MTFKEEQKAIYIGIYADDIKIGHAWIDTINQHLEGFEIYEPYQNKGYGQVALKRIIDEYHITRLEVKTDNERAKHIYEKFGFKYVEPKYYQMELEVLEDE